MSVTIVSQPLNTQTTGINDGNNDIFRAREVDKMRHELFRDSGDFYKLLDLKGPMKVKQPRFEYFETDLRKPSATVATTIAIDGTTLVVSDAGGITPKTRLYCEASGEIMLVTARTGNSLTIVRGDNGVAAIMAAGTKLAVLAPSLAEKESALTGTDVVYDSLYNFISRTSMDVSASSLQENCEMLGGIMQMSEQAQKIHIYLKQMINNDLWVSDRISKEDPTAANGYRYHTGGFNYWVTTNYLDLSDVEESISWDLLNTYTRDSFVPQASSREKFLFCGVNQYAALNQIIKDHMLPVEMSMAVDQNVIAKLGFMIQSFMTDEGNIIHLVLDRYGFSSDDARASNGAIVDMANIDLVEKSGEPLVWRQNIQLPNAHTLRDELWGSYGLRVLHEKTHMRIDGANPAYVL